MYAKLARNDCLFRSLNSVFVHDINNDNYLDIILDMKNRNNIYILFGYGNNRFYLKMIYLSINRVSRKWIVLADFNNDKHDDIISVNSQTTLVDVFLYEHECFIN
jgi:hypothetical protein